MVTSHKMMETEMGYRGSKSVSISPTVKEQRVDGSWCITAISQSNTAVMYLRCTLMGCESSYQVRILSKQLSIRTFSSSSLTPQPMPRIDPWFITGFSDAEGSFIVTVLPNKESKLGWRVSAYFSIHIQDIVDVALYLNKLEIPWVLVKLGKIVGQPLFSV
jgi:hypothetical protein